MIETNKVYCMDAFELLKQLPDKSVDLVLIDPPYNIGKDEWDKIDNYTEWFGSVLKEIERVLKDNGSFYFWHNQFPIIAKIQGWIEQNTKFIFKSLITWEKYQTNKQYFGRTVLMGVNNTSKRNYFPMAEYCLFYTFQDNNFLQDEIIKKINLFADYLTDQFEKAGVTRKEIAKLFPSKTNRLTGCVSNWLNGDNIICKEQYLKIREYLGNDFLKEDYDKILEKYNELRVINEEKRYTFNFVRTDITTTWLYPPTKKEGHLTPKPLEIIKDIISHSSKEGDVVLDCFVGSGTTAVACKKLNRNFICCDNNADYVAIANKRLAQQSVTDFTSATPTFFSQKEFNKGLEVQKSEISSPKLSPTEITSPNPNIKRNKGICHYD